MISQRNLRALVAVSLLSIVGCSPSSTGVRYSRDESPLYEGMGSYHREVTTSSESAQRYFDQGLVWSYAFNHDEAIRSFEQATRDDPECAMAWWGIALCNGPHINKPTVPIERSKAAWTALQAALQLKDSATPVERELIEALTFRYSDPPPADRSSLDRAYASAMKEVWNAYPNDADVGTLYAEAMMDLRPWDLWTEDGRPQPGTDEVLAVLEEAMRINPNIPGANHLYVHAVEASPHPDRANAAANRLRKLVPGSGHLVHMPSHIDVLTGRWKLASEQNERAIESDRKYRAISPKQGFYHLYMAHNHHMLAFASMMEGRREVAIRAARGVVAGVPEDYLRANVALMDPYMGALYDSLKRFGMWDEILSEPAPPTYLPITTAMWRFHRALAHAAKGDVFLAEKEKTAFLMAADRVPDNALMAISPAKNILQIATHMLEGEMALSRGDLDQSVAQLRAAVAIEDSLLYMEPPEWMQPVRHTLGAVLLKAGRYQEAEKVYREDLDKWPGNGWSLYGLTRSLTASDSTKEALEMERRFKKAWSRADTRIGSSCLCVPKT